MFSLLSAAGIVGSVILGIAGIRAGDHGQLERILAIACFAMAAAGFVGRFADDHKRAPPPELPSDYTLGGVFMVVMAVPLMAICMGVLLLTLVPSLYVMLPVFGLWGLAFGFDSERTHVPTPPASAQSAELYAT